MKSQKKAYPEFFSTKGCIIALERSRTNSTKKNELKDMLIAYQDSQTVAKESYNDMLVGITLAYHQQKIDSYEERWLINLLDSIYTNKLLDNLDYCVADSTIKIKK